jgi:putative membrane protein
MNDHEETRAIAEAETDPRVDLAVERTELALERTHLAWIRTMFTLITAGIAIDKGIAYLHEKRMASGAALVKNAHFIGLSLTLTGTFLLLVELSQFIKRNRQLAAMKKSRFIVLSTAVVLSFLVVLLGSAITILMITTR